MKKNFDYFSNREGRAAFIAKTFSEELKESTSVLDVGCDINTLKKIIGGKVTGIDLYGKPDITINLEKDKLTQFKNGEFDFIVCTEVLEHLENFHEMLDELVRVSNRSALISLPNCMNIFTRISIFLFGKAGKFYGLSIDKPDDRHRWFFSHKDVDKFFLEYTKKHSLHTTRKFLHCNYSNSLKGIATKALIKLFNIDSASQSYWILISK